MKRSFIIIFAILSTISAIGQTDVNASANQNNNYVALKMFNRDTLGYVQHNFIDNKKKYIGKDLNTLLKDLEIPIKSFMPGSSDLNQDISPFIHLQFYSYNKTIHKVDIVVVWSQVLPNVTVLRLSFKNNFAWTEEVLNYFGKQIIGDIITTQRK